MSLEHKNREIFVPKKSNTIKGKMYIPTDILFSYLSLLVLDFATWKIFTQRVLTVEIFSHISSMMSSV